jgi:hypothetical protein
LKKRILFILGAGLLVLSLGLLLDFVISDHTYWLTFEDCQKAGGEAWLVDLYHPDICPACTALRACETLHPEVPYEKLAEVCPQVTSCGECMQANFPYPDTCPGGAEKIGEISDAAIWWQCCR